MDFLIDLCFFDLLHSQNVLLLFPQPNIDLNIPKNFIKKRSRYFLGILFFNNHK
jgi:hypothetical protein